MCQYWVFVRVDSATAELRRQFEAAMQAHRECSRGIVEHQKHRESEADVVADRLQCTRQDRGRLAAAARRTYEPFDYPFEVVARGRGPTRFLRRCPPLRR